MCDPYVAHALDLARLRAGAAGGLAEMEKIFLNGGRFHNHLERSQLEEAYMAYRAANMKLGAAALAAKQFRWRQRPKSHSLEHAVYDFGGANLRYLANYLDEDFVRRSKQLAIRSTPKYVSRHVLFRYSIAVCLKWSGMQPE